MKCFIQRIYYPFIVGLAIAAFLFFKSYFNTETLPLLTYTIGFSAVLIVFISELIFPYRKDWQKNHGDFWTDLFFTNMALPALSKLAEIILAYFFVTHASYFVQENIHSLWPRDWPLLAQLLFILLIAEFLFYWTHRLGHTIPFLWRFHAIHHAASRVYWNNSGRFHPMDLFLNWIVYFTPLFLFGCSDDLIALFLVTNAITGLLEHANVDFKAGCLNYLFNTAELHRWHHAIEWKKANSNYGKVLCIWDLIFKTHYWPANEDVGQVGVRDTRVPTELVSAMVFPFKADSLSDGN
jgi:sterol desaturase/sphingolipid hydroxylase (fatty acid hydroxylase superfamily)